VNAPRLDRWLSLGVAAPLARLRARRHAIPILMYHSIADDVDDTVHPYFRTVTTPASFARQVGWLQRGGYEAVSLAEAIRLAHEPGALPQKKVVLTFDDGFRDFLTAALPILQSAGFGATVFLSTAYLGRPFLTGRPCLAAHEVKALSDGGIEFGSHSVSHRRLAEIPADQLAGEVADSKRAIEDITGSKVPFTITAGASTNSIFVDSTGRVGLRTSTPVLDLHIATSNTPAMRLEQNNSGGFTAQTWDIAGNEANFFVRDVTGGSRLPFRIRPGAPTSSIDISASGNVGIGTASPSALLHVASTGSASTDGKLLANEVMVFVRRLGTVAARPEGRIVLR